MASERFEHEWLPTREIYKRCANCACTDLEEAAYYECTQRLRHALEAAQAQLAAARREAIEECIAALDDMFPKPINSLRVVRSLLDPKS